VYLYITFVCVNECEGVCVLSEWGDCERDSVECLSVFAQVVVI
jgi:hypothetical protein